ncbi:MAG TPA: hypothetical protein DCY74_01725 [Clostridiales bacterium]|jgi:putative flippase GtrA|nr:hypothetical protein [Clostridiales bacterium]HCG34889.1 hypothetical protein [Clostridiales bacterium]
MKEFYYKHKEMADYLFSGVLTTIVGFGIYAVIISLGKPTMHNEDGSASNLLIIIAQIIQWIAAVLFAFAINKRYVFRDTTKEIRLVIKQFLVFSSSRLVTLVVETLLILGGVRSFLLNIHYQDWWVFSSENIAKLIAAVFVIISNYFISKFLVFQKKKFQKE